MRGSFVHEFSPEYDTLLSCLLRTHWLHKSKRFSHSLLPPFSLSFIIYLPHSLFPIITHSLSLSHSLSLFPIIPHSPFIPLSLSHSLILPLSLALFLSLTLFRLHYFTHLSVPFFTHFSLSFHSFHTTHSFSLILSVSTFFSLHLFLECSHNFSLLSLSRPPFSLIPSFLLPPLLPTSLAPFHPLSRPSL